MQPVTSAFIGWFTTWLAFFMLFHPRKPIRIFGVVIQGIFPKRQKVFANKLGGVVGKELLHFDEIAQQIKDPQAMASLMPAIEKHIDLFLNEKLKEKLPIIGMFVGQGTMVKIKEGLMEEINLLFPIVISAYADNLSNKIDVEKIVTDKINNFSSDKLEEILKGVLQKEFRLVELICGVFGFFIGLIQVCLVLVSR